MREFVSPTGERLQIPPEGERSMLALGWKPVPQPEVKKPARRKATRKE